MTVHRMTGDEVPWLCLPAFRPGRPCHALLLVLPGVGTAPGPLERSLREFSRATTSKKMGRAHWPRPISEHLLNTHSIRSKIPNIGRYSAMTIPPTIPPMTPIIRGSIMAVRDSVVASISMS